jgi:inner membrane protein
MEHIAVGLFVCLGLDFLLFDFNIIESVLYYVSVILGSLLPDIDTPKSYLGHKFKLLSTVINKAFGHRTATHSILVITVLFFISVIIFGMNTFLVGLTLGSLLHTLGDMTTSYGVSAVYPISKKRYKFMK